MRRVHTSIKVGRGGKRNKETKGIQGGGAPRGAGLRPGRVPPGQESSVPEKQELHQSSWVERHPQGVGAGRQDGGDALGLPGTLTDTCAPRRLHHTPRPSSLKDCRAHGAAGPTELQDPEQLGGAWVAAPHGGGCKARSSSERAPAEEEDPCGEGCGALGPAQRGSGGSATEAAVWPGGGIQQRRHWSTGCQDTAQDLASPWDRQSPGRPTTARTLLPRAEQVSVPALAPPGPAEGELHSYCGS